MLDNVYVSDVKRIKGKASHYLMDVYSDSEVLEDFVLITGGVKTVIIKHKYTDVTDIFARLINVV